MTPQEIETAKIVIQALKGFLWENAEICACRKSIDSAAASNQKIRVTVSDKAVSLSMHEDDEFTESDVAI